MKLLLRTSVLEFSTRLWSTESETAYIFTGLNFNFCTLTVTSKALMSLLFCLWLFFTFFFEWHFLCFFFFIPHLGEAALSASYCHWCSFSFYKVLNFVFIIYTILLTSCWNVCWCIFERLTDWALFANLKACDIIF